MCTPFIAVQGIDPRMSFEGGPMKERDPRCLEADEVQLTMERDP